MSATRRAMALSIDALEPLDDRITPSTIGHLPPPYPIGVAPVATPPPIYAPNGTALDKMGQSLNIIYQEYLNYQKAGAQGAFLSSQAGAIFFGGPNNTSVGVDIRVGANFGLVVQELKGIGMQVNVANAQLGLVEGYLPVSRLALVASDGNITSLAPVYRPVALGMIHR